MTDATAHFPFGRPLTPRKPSASEPRRVFVLGASPSALHVEWTPPAPFEPIAALAVDNEPTHFWTGDDEAAQVSAWVTRVGWRPEWGTVKPAGALNGSSGKWLDEKVLAPLAVTRAECWFTDCLDTYRFSRGQQDVVTSRYQPFAARHGLAWPGVPAALAHHSEDELFNEARSQLQRLVNELTAAKPQLVVTLGNAALRVFARIIGKEEPDTLEPNKEYGTAQGVTVAGRPATWLPLIHPGQRSKEWLRAHGRWVHARQTAA
jgi:uracil-DNA glycosylase